MTSSSTSSAPPEAAPGQPAVVTLPPLTGPGAATPAELALALVGVRSVSGAEAPLADAVETALGELEHLEVLRHGNTVVARTHLGRPERVVIAGHLDTVPVSRRTDNVPGRLECREGTEVIWGRGSVDMKGGVAVALHPEHAAPRRHLGLLRQRGGHQRPQRPGPDPPGTPRLAGGRLRRPGRAHGRPDRGRLQRHPARLPHRPRHRLPLRARLARHQRRPRRRPHH